MWKQAVFRVLIIIASLALVLGSLAAAVWWKEPELFAASGALMVIAGAVLTARRLLRLGYEAYVLDKQIIDGGHFAPTPEEIEAHRQFREDERAFQSSLPILVLGTLIWAYGSLALRWLGYGPT